MEFFVIIVNGWKPLVIITKSSILDAAAVLDLPLCKLLVDNRAHNNQIMESSACREFKGKLGNILYPVQ